jgi:NAD(P)-dependent dehydrogenase (short-subunit alcohol dehydrogenase family)
VPDLDAATLRTTVNGEVVQEAKLGEMIFSVAFLVHDLSRATRLRVGDVIMTGTPAGCGFKSQGPLTGISLEAARDVFEARFWGAVAAVKHAAARIGPEGSVTLTSGATAVRPTGRTTLADASAGAVETLTKGFAIELAPVRVNAVRPGIILTPRLTGIPEPQREPLFKAAAARTLVKKLGQPEQVAEAILFLMGNGYTTGSVITVDGGLLLA